MHFDAFDQDAPRPDECLLSRDMTVIVEPHGPWARAQRRTEYDVHLCELCEGQAHLTFYDERGYRYLKPCEGARLDRRLERFNRAQIPARYCDADFASFERYNPALEATVAALEYYVREFTPGDRGRVFMGAVGTGKTHLMIAILRYLTLQRGIACRFVEFTHLLSSLREQYSRNRSESEILAPLAQIPVLAIDELGKGRGSDFEHRIIDELISRRYNETSVTTLFTTNYYPREMQKATPDAGLYDDVGYVFGLDDPRPDYAPVEHLEDRVGDRVTSRLYEMCEFLPIPGEDYRRQRLYKHHDR